jgi:hypothetical protein
MNQRLKLYTFDNYHKWYGVKIGIKADTGIMLLKPSTVSAMVNVVGSWFQSVIDLGKYWVFVAVFWCLYVPEWIWICVWFWCQLTTGINRSVLLLLLLLPILCKLPLAYCCRLTLALLRLITHSSWVRSP